MAPTPHDRSSEGANPASTEVRMDAATVRRWCLAAVQAVGAHRDEIDKLNVYPVPDGDTGTNMLLTLRAMSDSLRRERPAALAACEAAALDEMQSRHPDAVDVQALEDQVSVTDTAGGQVEVTGGGQIAQDVGTWTPFGYTCSFSPTSGQVTRVEIR